MLKNTFEEHLKDDKERGLYRKFKVERTDGSSGPGGKHENCEYFVLDLTHDQHAVTSIRAYAASCREDYPALAEDLIAKADELDERDHCGICGRPLQFDQAKVHDPEAGACCPEHFTEEELAG